MKLTKGQKRELGMIFAGVILYAAAFIVLKVTDMADIWGLLLFAPSYLILGLPIIAKAVKNIAHGNMLDENFLMTIASVGAFCLLECSEGVAVMLFDRVGEFFEDYAVGKSRKNIAELVNLCPDFANVIRDGKIVEVMPDEVETGETVVVRPGEKVPVDGEIISGSTSFDTSGLTGESVPRSARAGDAAISGYINLSEKIEIKCFKTYADSTVSKILELIENATDKKSQSENFITRFARVYTPIVVGCAVALAVIPTLLHFAIPAVVTYGFSTWIYRALLFLVVSCPCALVISVPLTFFGGIGGASKRGILIKGSNYLEMLSKADTFVFDKTGTLTNGTFTVTEIISDDSDKTLFYAAASEQYSTHPIAKAIVAAAPSALPDVEVREIAGKGVEASFDGRTVLVGNAKLLCEAGVDFSEADTVKTVVYVAVDGAYLGTVLISDTVKPDAQKTISGINSFAKTVMLSGDSDKVAQSVAADLGLKAAFGNLLPQDKAEKFEKIKENHIAAFTGDGLNDAPVLAMADVGIAMGGLGSDAAIEAADVVIMDDSPSKILTARALAKKTMKIVKENIGFALVVKIGVMILGALGIASMWAAVFADVGVMIIAVFNAMRASRI